MSGNFNILPSNRAPIVGVIDPDAYTANAYSTAWIHMGTYKSIMAIVMAGTLGTNATVDAKLQQATDSGGSGVKDVTGKAITQLTEAGTDSDKQVVINCRDDELDVANDFDYVRLTVTVAVATSDAGAVVLGLDSPVQPAADLSTVDEVVA